MFTRGISNDFIQFVCILRLKIIVKHYYRPVLRAACMAVFLIRIYMYIAGAFNRPL